MTRNTLSLTALGALALALPAPAAAQTYAISPAAPSTPWPARRSRARW